MNFDSSCSQQTIPSTAGIDCSLGSPFRNPDWRWQRAKYLLHNGSCLRPDDDTHIRTALDFQHAQASATTDGQRAAVVHRWPDLSAAHQLHVRGGVTVDEVGARLLAGEGVEVIAGKTGVASSVIRVYENTFFAVLEARQATDWLLAQTLDMRAWRQRPPTERETWFYCAIIGGPAVLDLLIADHRGQLAPEHPEMHESAMKARFLVCEYAASRFPGAAWCKGMFEAGLRLFASAIMRAVEGGDQMLGQQIEFLRSLAQPPTDSRPPAALPAGRRPKRPRRTATQLTNPGVPLLAKPHQESVDDH
jgi:hypothetical protein